MNPGERVPRRARRAGERWRPLALIRRKQEGRGRELGLKFQRAAFAEPEGRRARR